MPGILILGAGRSSSSLISYVQQQASKRQWQLTVGDYSKQAATERIAAGHYGKPIRFDIHDQALSNAVIADADVVVSLLPAHLHFEVARHCLLHKKHLLTASYVTSEMNDLH